jgi:hypothetical protein
MTIQLAGPTLSLGAVSGRSTNDRRPWDSVLETFVPCLSHDDGCWLSSRRLCTSHEFTKLSSSNSPPWRRRRRRRRKCLHQESIRHYCPRRRPRAPREHNHRAPVTGCGTSHGSALESRLPAQNAAVARLGRVCNFLSRRHDGQHRAFTHSSPLPSSCGPPKHTCADGRPSLGNVSADNRALPTNSATGADQCAQCV